MKVFKVIDCVSENVMKNIFFIFKLSHFLNTYNIYIYIYKILDKINCDWGPTMAMVTTDDNWGGGGGLGPV